MNQKIKILVPILCLSLALLLLPQFSLAEEETDLSTSGGGLTAECKDKESGCGFYDLFEMINKVVKFILIDLAVPIAAIMFAYAGFLMLTSGGETSKRAKAKSIFVNVAIGLALVAAAWLIVHTILIIVGAKTGAGWNWFGFEKGI